MNSDRDDRQRPAHASGASPRAAATIRIVPMTTSMRAADCRRGKRGRRRCTGCRGPTTATATAQQPVDQRHAARRASQAWRAAVRAAPCAAERPGRSGRARTPGARRDASSRAAGRSRRCSSGSTTATISSAADDQRRRRHDRPEAHLGVELLLELAVSCRRRRSACRHRGLASHAKHLAAAAPRDAVIDGRARSATSAARLPCRTSRRPDGTGCRRPRWRSPCVIALPLAWPASSSLRGCCRSTAPW